MATLPTLVRPGDVISSDLFNLLLADLADLQVRVANIEQGTTIDGPPVIDHFEPGDVLHMGDELTVVGRNLKIGNLVSVKLAGTPIVSFKSQKSTDSDLVFDIPAILGINPPGAVVSLEVTNSMGGPVSKSMFLMPSQASTLNASFGFTVTAPTSPIPASGSGNYVFAISAVTTADETYLVIPTIDSGWTATPSQPELFIHASPSTPSLASVTVAVGAPASGSATLRIELRAKNFAGKSFFSQNVPVSVGASSGGTNPDFTPTSTSAFPTAALSNGQLKLGAGKNATLTQTVRLAKAGTYLITAAVTPGGAPWTAVVQNNPNPVPTTAINTSVDAIVSLTGAATIPAGATGKLTVTYQRQTSPTDSASFQFDIGP